MKLLFNGETIKKKSFNYDPRSAAVTISGNSEDYKNWLSRVGEVIEFEIAETGIKSDLMISNVILIVKEEVEILILLSSADQA